MRKIFLFSIIFLLFFSCNNHAEPEYYVVISVNEDQNIIFHQGIDPHFTTINNVEFTLYYEVVPSNSSIKVDDVDVYSTDPEVIEIIDVNTNSCIIKALTKNDGVAKVRIKTEKYHSSTSLYISVQ